MSITNNVQTLIPDTEDIYTADIRHFFITVASLVPNDFMDIIVEAELSYAEETVQLNLVN